MKSIFNNLTLSVICVLLAASCGPSGSTETAAYATPVYADTQYSDTPSDTQEIPLAPPVDVDSNKTRKQDTVLIKTTAGDITVVLYNETPLHRDNFLRLMSQNFYNGILFHRVMRDFMIQTGDPNSKDKDPGNDGQGGPGYTIPAEINPQLLHKRGALAAARLGDQVNPERASSGSQFYICHVATPQLDNQYTVFGETIKGFEVIDKIATMPIPMPGPDGSGKPAKDVKIISMTIVKGKPGKASKKTS